MHRVSMGARALGISGKPGKRTALFFAGIAFGILSAVTVHAKPSRYFCNSADGWNQFCTSYGLDARSADLVRKSVFRLEGGCSAVAISPTYLLSAAHCNLKSLDDPQPRKDRFKAATIENEPAITVHRVAQFWDRGAEDFLVLKRTQGRFSHFIPPDFGSPDEESLAKNSGYFIAGFPSEFWMIKFLYNRVYSRGRLFVSSVVGVPQLQNIIDWKRENFVDNPGMVLKQGGLPWMEWPKEDYEGEILAVESDVRGGNSGGPLIRLENTGSGYRLTVVGIASKANGDAKSACVALGSLQRALKRIDFQLDD